MPRLLLVVGMPGCGKGALIDVAIKKGYRPVVMGDIVREESVKRGYGIKGSGTVAKTLRKENGLAASAHLALERLDESGSYIIDGIRGQMEVEEFKKHYDTCVIAIHASPNTRFMRLHSRGRDDDPPNRGVCEERDARELGFGIGDAIALADIMLVNESGIEAFSEKVENLFGDLD